jgi:hypothetical protein
MFEIIVKGNFEKEKLEKMQQEEIAIYQKAIKSLDSLEEVMDKHFAPMLIKKGFNPNTVREALKPFYQGYDFSWNILEDGVKIVWDGHYFIDYREEMIISTMFAAFNMFRPFWFFPQMIQSKLNAIRNPKAFFLPKLNEPLIREKYMAKLLEEVTKRFKKLDANCVIESVFRDNYAATS